MVIRTVDEAIETVGGTAVVADALGVGRSTVSSWRARNSLPAEYWQAFVSFAHSRGEAAVTLSVLAAIHAREASEARA